MFNPALKKPTYRRTQNGFTYGRTSEDESVRDACLTSERKKYSKLREALRVSIMDTATTAAIGQGSEDVGEFFIQERALSTKLWPLLKWTGEAKGENTVKKAFDQIKKLHA